MMDKVETASNRSAIRGIGLGLVLVVSSVIALAGCGLSGGLIVGSTNFTESRILANIYAVALSDAGHAAQVKELSGREILEPALEKGQVKIIPDYLGTFTEFLNVKENGPDATPVASNDVESTYAAAQKLAAPRGLTVLSPAPAQDQNAFAVTPEYAAKNNLSTLSQMGTFSQTNPVTLGAGPECPKRKFCQLGLQDTYGIKFAGFVPLDAGGPLTVQALLQNKIQLGLVFTSSGSIAAYNLKVLADDKSLMTADNVIPVVNTAALTPEIQKTLNAVSAKLTTADLQQLNAAVDLQREDPYNVAKDWLSKNGLSGSASPSSN